MEAAIAGFAGALLETVEFQRQYVGPQAGEGMKTMRGRVRLCPYYFIGEQKTVCGGALATICPDDKKLLHGMPDVRTALNNYLEKE